MVDVWLLPHITAHHLMFPDDSSGKRSHMETLLNSNIRYVWLRRLFIHALVTAPVEAARNLAVRRRVR
jgi:hypothetical protein